MTISPPNVAEIIDWKSLTSTSEWFMHHIQINEILRKKVDVQVGEAEGTAADQKKVDVCC